jgi:hypothetical protein
MCCPTGQRPSMRWGLSASGLWHAAGCQRPDRQDQPPSTTRGALAACSHVCPSMQEAACISWYGNGPQTDQNLRKPRLDSTRSTLSAAPLCLSSAPSRHRKDSADDRHSACIRYLSWGRRCVALARTPERTKYLILTCRAVPAVRSWCCLSRLRPHRPFARLTRPPSLVVWYCSSSTRQAEPAVGVDVLCCSVQHSFAIRDDQPTHGLRTTTQDEPGSTRWCPQAIGRARTWACHHLIFPNALRLRKPSSYTHARTSDRQ